MSDNWEDYFWLADPKQNMVNDESKLFVCVTVFD